MKLWAHRYSAAGSSGSLQCSTVHLDNYLYIDFLVTDVFLVVVLLPLCDFYSVLSDRVYA